MKEYNLKAIKEAANYNIHYMILRNNYFLDIKGKIYGGMMEFEPIYEFDTDEDEYQSNILFVDLN
jgi:hypothetical protein